jgi:hypothetical protein
MKDRVKSLLEEEKDLEQRAFGTRQEEQTNPTDPATVVSDPSKAPPTSEEPVIPPEKPAEPIVEPTEDWEKRYKNLRASRDEGLYNAKASLASALDQITILKDQIKELQTKMPVVDPLDSVFTQEDTDKLGEATVETMKRVTKQVRESVSKPLQDELENERKLRRKQDELNVQKAKSDAYSIFLRRIADAVPDWEAINFDPGFEKYLKEPDIDGTSRIKYFQEADASGNAALVARYMKDYKDSKVSIKDPLLSKVTPVGDNTGATQIKEKHEETISHSYINKFYDDLSRGRYAGRATEAKAIEAKIDRAVFKGLVVNK